MISRAAICLCILTTLSCSGPGSDKRSSAIVRIDPPALAGAMAPFVVAAGSSVFMTWIEPWEEGHRVRFSSLRPDRSWSEPSTAAEGSDFFVNWADFPSVEMTSSGDLIAHWLQKSGPETYAYDVRLARSTDGGALWVPLGAVHSDATQTEHGFVSLVSEEAGMRAFWLDGREMVEEGGPMTLRTAVIRGDEVGGRELLDGMTCECCQTDAVMTSRGPVVVYRDRTEEEIRDIAIVRRADGGWTSPEILHADGWEVPGCPVNGPAIAADGRLVAVAWFTAADNRPRVQVAVSRDAGASFEEPVVIDVVDPVGRVDVALDAMGNPIVSWVAGVNEERVEVRMIRVPIGDREQTEDDGAPLTLATTDRSRASGFPRMARRGDDLVVAWTDPSEGSSVRAAIVRVEDVPFVAGREEEAPESADLGGPVEYSALSFQGQRISLSQFRGRVVLLNFWATWCKPCREEAPVLSRLAAREGLTVVGVSLDHASQEEAVRAFVREMKLPYLNLHDKEELASRVFEIPVVPLSLLIDPEGKVVWRRDGVILDEDPDLEKVLARVLP